MDYFVDQDSIRPVRNLSETLQDYSQLRKTNRMYGTLLLLGWTLIPAAIACSLLLPHHYKQSRRHFFLFLHASLMVIGTVLNIAGWVIGLVNDDTWDNAPSAEQPWLGGKSDDHAVLGLVVFCGTVFNLLFSLVMICKSRPGRRDTFEEWTFLQQIGQLGNGLLGHVLAVLALVTCGIGTRITPVLGNNEESLKGFVSALAVSTLFSLVYLADKRQNISLVNVCTYPKVDELYDPGV
jgi:hypothetical protein